MTEFIRSHELSNEYLFNKFLYLKVDLSAMKYALKLFDVSERSTKVKNIDRREKKETW